MAELDVLKFKMVVRSMENAFGVDREVDFEEVPMGTSIIKQTFTPTEPRSTPLSSVRQASVTDSEALEIKNLALYKVAKQQSQAEQLQKLLLSEIQSNLLSVEMVEDRVVIRINEQASFPSGSANLKSAFIPVLEKIHLALAKTDADFIVSGHTDDIPVRSARYRSNWELSAARATSVVHKLLRNDVLSPRRFRIEGHGSTKALVENSNDRNRAINRRVEIGLIN